MNQTLNSTSYSFVQSNSSRVNLTTKPATANTDNRVSASPYKVIHRRDTIESGMSKSPSRKTINFNYTNASPYKECVNTQPRTVSSRSESVQITAVEEKVKTAHQHLYHTKGTQTAQNQLSNNSHIPHSSLNQATHSTLATQQNSQFYAQSPQPISHIPAQNSRVHFPIPDSKPSSKIMSAEKKNAIDQIINNCTILNNRLHDENSRLNQTKQNSIGAKGNHPVTVNLISWPVKPQSKVTGQQSQNAQDLLCMNGDNKKVSSVITQAKYRAEDNPNNVFCSKCSIILVGKGIRIIDIQPQKTASQNSNQTQPQLTKSPTIPFDTSTETKTSEATRQIQLKELIGSVSQVKQDLVKNLQGIEKERQQLLTRSKEQKDSIMKTYEELYRTLKQYESKDLNRVLYYQEECVRHLQIYETEFKESISRLDLIHQDIVPNINMIKMQIEELQYKAFLTDYKKQVKEITQKLDTYAKNVSYSAKPEVVKKDVTKLAYDIISLIDYPIGFNKNSLYFSFEGKNSGSSNSTEKSNTILVEDYGESTILTLSQSGSVGDSAQVSPPFRALFNDDVQEGGNGSASPSFKKL